MKKIEGLFIAVFVAFSVFAQDKTCLKKKHKADDFFQANKYHEALALYLHLNATCKTSLLDPNELNYKIGLCYYYSESEREKAIPYLKTYIANTDSTVDAHFFLAKTYHYLNRFDEAIVEYEKFKHYVLNDTLQYGHEIVDKVIESVDHEIKRCNYGKSIINIPVDVVVENLGPVINTKYSEYAPVISHDEKLLAYTARYPKNVGGKISPDGDYFEDIYITEITEGGLFTIPKNISKQAGFFSLMKPFKAKEPWPISDEVNTKIHEGAVQFSLDDKKLYLYSDYNIWVSEYKDGKWQKPHKIAELSNVLDEKAYEPSVSISQDMSLLFFSSDRKGGYGGLDLYVSRRQQDGSWSDPENLGPTINTPFDEDGPYIDPDDRTLYFSSKGHSSIGGYDVFKTVFNGKYWSVPQNMGFPINSGGDDIFYMMTPILNRAYYSSNKAGGYGKMDIYRLTFAHEREPIAEIAGYVYEGDSLKPVQATISVFDPEYKNLLYKQKTDSLGKYLLVFDHGKDYAIRVESEDFVPYTKVFHIPEQVYYYQYYQEIHYIILKDKLGNVIGQKVEVYNNLFDDQHPVTDSLTVADSLIEVNKFTDVRFFVSQDSLEKIVERDGDLDFIVPQYASVSFLKDSVSVQDSLTENSFEPPLRSLPDAIQPQKNMRYEKLFTIRKNLIDVEKDLTYMDNFILSDLQYDTLNQQLKLVQYHVVKAKELAIQYKEMIALHGENSTEAHYILEQLESEMSAAQFEYQKLNGMVVALDVLSEEEVELVNAQFEKNKKKLSQGQNMVEEVFSQEFEYYTTDELLTKTQEKITETQKSVDRVNVLNTDIEQSVREAERRIREVQAELDNLLSLYEKYASPEFAKSQEYQQTKDKLLATKYALAQAQADLRAQQKAVPATIELVSETRRYIKESQIHIEKLIELNSKELPEDKLSELENMKKQLEKTGKELAGYEKGILQKIKKQDELILKDIDTARHYVEKAEQQFYHVEIIVRDTLVYNKIEQAKELEKAMNNIKDAVETSNKMLQMAERDAKKVEQEIKELSNYLDTSSVHVANVLEEKQLFREQLKETEEKLSDISNNQTPNKENINISNAHIIPKFIIHFDFDKSQIKSTEKAKLDSLADIMKTYPQLKYKAVGHTDSKGSDSYNMQLSKRRAIQAVNYMVATYGISKTRFEIDYKGEEFPVAPNTFPDGRDNPAGRAKNRRVEFILIQ